VKLGLTTIDPESLMLQGVRPAHWNMPAGKKLILKFHAQQIISSLGPVNDGDVVVLLLTGEDLSRIRLQYVRPVIAIK
jgi:hypothetical protein